MKRIVNLLLALSLPLFAFAQWEAGVDLGASFGRTDKEPEPNFDMAGSTAFVPEVRVGYTFGSNSQWNVNMGPTFFTKRYQLKPTELWMGDEPEACRFRYFSLPVMLTYRIPMAKFWLGLSCGMQGDFFIGQKAPMLTYSEDYSQRYQLDNKEMNHGFDFLAGGELGYQINESWKVLASYRHVFDLVRADERGFHGRLSSDVISLGFRYVISDVVTVDSYDR